MCPTTTSPNNCLVRGPRPNPRSPTGHLQKHKRSSAHETRVEMTQAFGIPTSDNPRPYGCPECDTAFRKHGHLAKHLRSKSHIIKLEANGLVPVGTYAALDKCGQELKDGLVTTNCEQSLASLRKIAMQLFQQQAGNEPAMALAGQASGARSRPAAGATKRTKSENKAHQQPTPPVGPMDSALAPPASSSSSAGVEQLQSFLEPTGQQQAHQAPSMLSAHQQPYRQLHSLDYTLPGPGVIERPTGSLLSATPVGQANQLLNSHGLQQQPSVSQAHQRHPFEMEFSATAGMQQAGPLHHQRLSPIASNCDGAPFMATQQQATAVSRSHLPSVNQMIVSTPPLVASCTTASAATGYQAPQALDISHQQQAPCHVHQQQQFHQDHFQRQLSLSAPPPQQHRYVPATAAALPLSPAAGLASTYYQAGNNLSHHHHHYQPAPNLTFKLEPAQALFGQQYGEGGQAGAMQQPNIL